MSSKLAKSIVKVMSDEKDVRAATRSHQAEFPYDREMETQVTRREFCNFLGLTSTALFVGAAGYAAKTEFDEWRPAAVNAVEIEGADVLGNNSSLNFRFPTPVDPAILIKLTDGSYRAFGQKCTHLSCPVYYAPEHSRLECPCHEAGFEARTGRVLYGPPPTGLDRIALEVRNGRVWAIGLVKGEETNESDG